MKKKDIQHIIQFFLSYISYPSRIEKAQLAAIFELLKKQEDEFNLGNTIREDDVKAQLNLYR